MPRVYTYDNLELTEVSNVGTGKNTIACRKRFPRTRHTNPTCSYSARQGSSPLALGERMKSPTQPQDDTTALSAVRSPSTYILPRRSAACDPQHSCRHPAMNQSSLRSDETGNTPSQTILASADSASIDGDGLPLPELCARVHARVESFLNKEPKTERMRGTQAQTRISLAVIEEALERYR